MSLPLVSVIIPTYNRREYVQEAIDSVLAQTYRDFEIIVIDDGSTDGTGEALTARYGDQIRYIWQKNAGESAARNLGIDIARGQYVAFLDSDDLWLPNKLVKQIVVLRQNSQVGLVYSYVYQIDREGRRLPGAPLGESTADVQPVFENLVQSCIFAPGTVVARKDCLQQVEGFDLTIQYGEDWDLWLRLSLVTEFSAVREPLAEIRVHQGGQWRFPNLNTVDRMLDDHLRLLRRAFLLWGQDHARASFLQRMAVANEYDRAAWACFQLGENERASHFLSHAFDIDPDRCTDMLRLARGIVGSLAMQEQMNGGHSSVDLEEFIDTVRAHMPECASELGKRRMALLAQCHLELAHQCYQQGNHQLSGQHLARALFYRPVHLTDRGTMSFLADVVVGTNITNVMRRLKRQVVRNAQD